MTGWIVENTRSCGTRRSVMTFRHVIATESDTAPVSLPRPRRSVGIGIATVAWLMLHLQRERALSTRAPEPARRGVRSVGGRHRPGSARARSATRDTAPAHRG